MRLATVMSLVVEEMIERRRQRLFDGLRVDERAVAYAADKIVVAQARDIAGDAGILAHARRPQGRKIFEQNSVEACR